eukprot:4393485-Amphidinium_carterae.1
MPKFPFHPVAFENPALLVALVTFYFQVVSATIGCQSLTIRLNLNPLVQKSIDAQPPKRASLEQTSIDITPVTKLQSKPLTELEPFCTNTLSAKRATQTTAQLPPLLRPIKNNPPDRE